MKQVFRKFIVLIAGLVIMSMPFLASAQTLEQKRDAAAAAAANAKAQATTKQQQAADIQQQTAKLTVQIDENKKAIAGTEEQINSVQKKIDELTASIKVEEGNLAVENEKLNQLISSWYMEGDNSSITSAILGSNTLSEVVTKNEYYDSINQQIEIGIKKIEEIKNNLQTQKSDQDKQLVVLKGLKDEQILQRDSLTSSLRMKNRLLTDTNSAITELKQTEAKALKEEAAAQGEIRLREEAAAGGRTGVLGGVSAQGFAWPVANYGLGCGYGYSDCYFPGVFHTGIDIRYPSGAEIMASKGGTVVDTRDGMGNTYPYDKSYGNFVKIRHEGGAITLYGHLLPGSVNVSIGNYVNQGSIIGRMGNSGYSTGTHLHFEMRDSADNTVNPLSYLL